MLAQSGKRFQPTLELRDATRHACRREKSRSALRCRRNTLEAQVFEALNLFAGYKSLTRRGRRPFTEHARFGERPGAFFSEFVAIQHLGQADGRRLQA
jgi:hypothetical protein